jgi:PPP family 3-phenylpropionic acid transporter
MKNYRVPKDLIVIAFLVIGSHALNDTVAVIQWREAGYSNLSVSLMWSDAVMAEVVVFFLLGPWLIARLGLAGAATLSACAGVRCVGA